MAGNEPHPEVDRVEPQPDPPWARHVDMFRHALPEELLPGFAHGFVFEAPVIQMSRYLPWLREQLQRYFPAFLALGGEDDASWKMALLELAPTPAEAASLPRAKLARLIKAHRVRCHDADAMRAILKAPAPKVSAATVAAARAHVLALLKAARLAAEQHKEAVAMLDKLTSALAAPEESEPESPGGQTVQRDAAILLSSPGLGRMTCATLLTEAPQAVRERDYHALRCLAGVAPVTRQSGKHRSVTRRYACDRRLRNALFYWARSAVVEDDRCRARYEALRARGKSWGCALRNIADRLLYVTCAMLRDGTLYDANKGAQAIKTA